MKIYVASSWRNKYQPDVVKALREAGHDVYDFRNPEPGNNGFAWSSIDPEWERWTTEQFKASLEHPIAKAGFNHDMKALSSAEATVLVLPCGRSAHLELGYAVLDQFTFVYSPEPMEPELMYRMVDGIYDSLPDLLEELIKVSSFSEGPDPQKESTP